MTEEKLLVDMSDQELWETCREGKRMQTEWRALEKSSTHYVEGRNIAGSIAIVYCSGAKQAAILADELNSTKGFDVIVVGSETMNS